jgi:ubiquinone/menaquinone biosynthesis C-methylase UbiE
MSTTDADSERVKQSLSKPDIHDEWESRYREEDILRLQQETLDRLLDLVRPAPGSRFLDVGCGTGFNAIRLAHRGFDVLAVDFSEAVLEQARDNIRAARLDDRIELGREDLLALTLPDETADQILCWGVLMHIPDIEKAISELVRVLRPGGTLIVCEGNMHALDELALRVLDRFGRTVSRKRVPAGTERWRQTPAGPLLARRADIGWLIRAFEERDLVLSRRLACQLTEAYVYARPGTIVRQGIEGLNRLWFQHVRTGTLASDNFLVFNKPQSAAA